MDISILRRKVQRLKDTTKFGVATLCFLMTMHCGLLCLGYSPIIADALSALVVFLIGINLLKTLKLCWIQRLSVTYSLLVVLTGMSEDYLPVPCEYIQEAHVVTFIVGGVMFVLNIYRAINP